ncbi:MAG: hypothetical protein ACRC7C_12965 [Beijerinckiaceae bacterium]
MKRDIAIVICSRGREDYLWQLLEDIDLAYGPALTTGGLSYCTAVYAQGYSPAYITSLSRRFVAAIDAGRLTIIEAERSHSCIGEVVSTAITAIHAKLDYRLAMLMDDDSRYRADPVVDENLRTAACDFLKHDDRAFSIKLGTSRALEYWPFVDSAGPIMPFKEKMLWVSREVLEEALAFPGFSTLSVGEDVVLSAIAWRGDSARCFGVFGIATFLHLAFEPDIDVNHASIGGGYGELVGYVDGVSPATELGKYEKAYRSGTTPDHIMPDIFVGRGHPHHVISGIKPEAIMRYATVSAASGRGRRVG